MLPFLPSTIITHQEKWISLPREHTHTPTHCCPRDNQSHKLSSSSSSSSSSLSHALPYRDHMEFLPVGLLPWLQGHSVGCIWHARTITLGWLSPHPLPSFKPPDCGLSWGEIERKPSFSLNMLGHLCYLAPHRSVVWVPLQILQKIFSKISHHFLLLHQPLLERPLAGWLAG